MGKATDADELDKSARIRRGMPEMAGENDIVLPPPPRSRRSGAEEEKEEEKAPHEDDPNQSAKTLSNEHKGVEKGEPAPDPPNLREYSYIRPHPGAIAVNGTNRRYRSNSQGDDEISTLTNSRAGPATEINDSQRSSVLQSGGFLSSLTPEESTPIIATVVDRDLVSRPSTIQSHYEVKDIPLRLILKDRRLLGLAFVLVLIIVGLTAWLVLVLSRSGANTIASSQGTAVGPEGDDTTTMGQGPIGSLTTTFSPAATMTLSPTRAPTLSPTGAPTPQSLQQLLAAASPDGGVALITGSMPQRLALEYIENHPALETHSEAQLQQTYAAQVFRFGIEDTSGVDIAATGRGLVLPDPTDECTWSAMTCNNDNQITDIILANQDFVFTLPGELTLLSQLELLDFQGCSAIGTLPPALAKLTRLQRMKIGYNDFSGTLPTEYCTMQSLQMLGAHNLKLTGTIPTEFGFSTTLYEISIMGSRLIGTIPSEIFTNQALERLYVHDNALWGTIPTEIANAKNLGSFQAFKNELTGTLPTEIGSLTALQQLAIDENQFEGTIPTEFENFGDSMRVFNLAFNKLIGTIPKGLSRMTLMWGTFALSNNLLTGTIHTEFGRLREISSFELASNKFTGTIPTQLGFLTGIFNNLDLSDNDLSGTIPSDLGKLFELKSLALEKNTKLSGTFPDQLGNLGMLTSLTAFDNNMNGFLPSKVCALAASSLTSIKINCEIQCTCCGEFCF